VRYRISWLVPCAVIAIAGCTSSSGSVKPQTPEAAASEAAASGAASIATGPPLAFEQVRGMVSAYKAAHSGNGGKDWDINTKTAKQVADDPAAQKLLSICGKDQRPVIPLLAWEYGGNDHRWISPDKSALIYCVYTPVKKTSEHWKYDARKNHVTTDIYVRFPDQNPCKDKQGTEQVDACLGDHTNYEILVDTASLNDGHDVGLELADSSTALWLVFPDRTKDLLANFD
jgi:hypothetical protein